LKQLLPLNDRPVIRHCLDSILSSGLCDVVTVVRPGSENIIRAVSGFTKKVAFNERPESGMAGSVKAGIEMIDPASTGVLICLSDHPLVRTDTYRALLEAHFETPRHIIIPVYRGKKGHPPLFPADIVKEIYSGFTLSEIVRKDDKRVRYMPVPDEGVVLDMDTREDYSMILIKLASPRYDEGNESENLIRPPGEGGGCLD
jgi:molybdenum cofactor cytidylyltransferase